MRSMNRNKRTFYYALLESVTDDVDEYGNITGEHTLTYGKPQKFRANISAAKGEAETAEFGENLNYDRVIILNSDAPKIDEYSILWIDTFPEIKEDGTTDTPHDYIVNRVAKYLNSISLAVSKVDVSNE